MQSHRMPLYCALATYLLLGLALIARVPMGASPDEAAHWQYIEYIASNWRLPVFTGAVPPNAGYEFHQPPLYYAICAPFWALLPAGVENYFVRFISLLCGLGTLIWLYHAARIVFPNSSVASYAVVLAALSPLHLGIGAGTNNDGLAGFFTAWLFYLMAKVWRDGPQKREVLLTGLVIALGLYTKTTTATVSFVALLALYFAARKHESKTPLAPILGAAAIALLVALPLFARNQLLYGDPLGYAQFSAAAKAASPGLFQFEQAGISAFNYIRGMIWLIFLTTWGFFGGPSSAVAATKPLGQITVNETWLAPLLLVCILFPLVAVLGLRRIENLKENWESVWKWWLSAAALVVLAWMNFAFNHIAGGQARYLHPAFLPFTIAFVAGLLAILPMRARPVAASFLGLVLLTLNGLNLWVWKTLV
jgi:4-amino-4-deoxy-L-arabinose transferase-like glycosyltransferase